MSQSFVLGSRVVRPPRFEPGSPAWEASVLTMLDYGRIQFNIHATTKNKTSLFMKTSARHMLQCLCVEHTCDSS